MYSSVFIGLQSDELTHLPSDKMAVKLQVITQSAILLMNIPIFLIIVCSLKSDWNCDWSF